MGTGYLAEVFKGSSKQLYHKGDCVTTCSGPRLAENGLESGAPASVWLKTVLKTFLKAVLRPAFGLKTMNTNKKV